MGYLTGAAVTAVATGGIGAGGLSASAGAALANASGLTAIKALPSLIRSIPAMVRSVPALLDGATTAARTTLAALRMSKPTAATLAAGERATATAAETTTGQVGYGSTALSEAVQGARIAGKDRGGNYAAGMLDDGTTIVGRSSADLHAEQDVLNQAGDRRITDLFTEREPCAARCAGLTDEMNVTWSWPWNPSTVRATTNASLRAAAKELFS